MTSFVTGDSCNFEEAWTAGQGEHYPATNPSLPATSLTLVYRSFRVFNSIHQNTADTPAVKV